MIGFTAAYAKTINEIFYKHIPKKYQDVFYQILTQAASGALSVDYIWYFEDGPYGDLVQILKENGFGVEEIYEDCHSIILLIYF